MSENTTAKVNDNDNPNKTDEQPKAEQTVTAYQAAKIVNALLAEDGVMDDETGEPKEIAPQMLYGYVKSGRIPSVEHTLSSGKTQKRVPLSALGAWYQDYRAGNVGRGDTASTKKLVADLKASLSS